LALAESALKKGKKVFWCEPHNIYYFNQDIFVCDSAEILSVNANEIKHKKNEEKILFSDFQFCFVRKDPPFDEGYKNLCWILTAQSQVKIINSAESLLSFHEKSLHWRAYSEGVLSQEHMIPTCLTHQISVVGEFCNQFTSTHPIYKKYLGKASGVNAQFICKPWLGHGGEDIRLFKNKDLLLKYLQIESDQLFLVQPFLEEITTEGDRRVMIVNGQVIFDFVRLPAQGKIASNGAQGGSAVLRKMTTEQMDICLKVAKFLKDKNILFAGLDLIGLCVGEINITSPTGIRVYEFLTNINMSDEIFSLLVD